MNKRIRKKHAKRNWLRLQQEMTDIAAFYRKYAGTDPLSPNWQKQAIWIGGEAQERERPASDTPRMKGQGYPEAEDR